MPFPFGSEMPWDSTGQEEVSQSLVCMHVTCLYIIEGFFMSATQVYLWSKAFGFYNQSNATLDAVLAYSPRLPSWAYQGNKYGVSTGRALVVHDSLLHRNLDFFLRTSLSA